MTIDVEVRSIGGWTHHSSHDSLKEAIDQSDMVGGRVVCNEDTNVLDICEVNQGEDDQGRRFGYCGINDMGGQFFTHMPTLEETLATVEDDDTDPPIDWPDFAYKQAVDFIRREWQSGAIRFRR